MWTWDITESQTDPIWIGLQSLQNGYGTNEDHVSKSVHIDAIRIANCLCTRSFRRSFCSFCLYQRPPWTSNKTIRMSSKCRLSALIQEVSQCWVLKPIYKECLDCHGIKHIWTKRKCCDLIAHYVRSRSKDYSRCIYMAAAGWKVLRK